jgi:hypothetical protein
MDNVLKYRIIRIKMKQINYLKTGRKWGKRGEDMLVDFWAILIFAVIILLFFILFATTKSGSNKTLTEFDGKDANFMLDSFLRAPVPSEDKTVAEIIVEESAVDGGKFDRTGKLFEEFFKRTNTMNSIDINDIHLEIKGYNSGSMNIVKDKGAGSFGKYSLISSGAATEKSYSATTTIPGYTGNIQITLRLSQLPLVGVNVAGTSTNPTNGAGSTGGAQAPVLKQGH